MQQIGYSIVKLDDGSEYKFWGDTPNQIAGPPDVIRLPDLIQVYCPEVGFEVNGYRLVERWLDYGDTESIIFDGQKVIVTRILSV